MDNTQKFAPILHTGFGDTYGSEDMRSFIAWLEAQGFSGFSAEGKAKTPTADIDRWIEGYMRGIGHALTEAEKRGLEVWLFDEWGYPTGTAAGKTMENRPEWRSKRLHLALDVVLEKGQTVSCTAPVRFLCAAVWRVGRDTLGAPLSEDTPILPVNGVITHTAIHRRERLCAVSWEFDNFRTVGVFPPDPDDDKLGTLDLMCREAVAEFIRQMHERYWALFGDHFGKAFRGFFYDEPYLSFPVPYTFDIMDEFASTKGYDLLPRLPRALAGLANHELSDYRDVCTTRTADAFYGQMGRWCRARGVEMVGHQDLDHAVRTLDSVSGHFFKNSAASDAPGVDYIWAQLQPGMFADFPRFAGSAKRFLGKSHAASESFAATGKCLFPDYMRFCMDHQIVRGIDRFFLMIADPVPEDGVFFTPLSRNHPQSVAFGRALNRRVALANALANSGEPAGRIALYIPMEAVFSGLIRLKQPSAVSAAPYRPAWEYVEEAARALCHLPVDFDYIWKQALLELPLQDNALAAPGGGLIDTLIFPPCAALEEGVEWKVTAFLDAGGRVIFLGNAPDTLIGRCETAPDARHLAMAVKPDVLLSDPGWISSARRKTKDGELFLLLNEDEFPHTSRALFPAEGPLARYDFAREGWVAVGGAQSGLALSLAPMELAVFRAGGPVADALPAREPAGAPVTVSGWRALSPDGQEFDLSGGLRDWRDFYRADHTGWMTYKAVIDIPSGGLYGLDLGHVCYAAVVRVAGQERPAAFAPYVLDLNLPAGRHTLEIDVLNTAVNENVGTPDAERANLTGGNRGWLKTRMANDRKYLASGLLGPVALTPAR